MKKRTGTWKIIKFNTEIKHIVTGKKTKETLCDKPGSRLDTAEERVSKLEEWAEKIAQSTAEREKNVF